MNFSALELGYCFSFRHKWLCRSYYWDCNNISLKFAIDFNFFAFFFELIDLQGPMKFFRSCWYNTGLISDKKFGLNIFLKPIYLKRSNFSFGLNSSRVLAMIIFLYSLFDYFSFSTFWDVFVCVLVGNVYLICWSGRVSLSFSVNSADCISGLLLLCFFLKSFYILITFFVLRGSQFFTFDFWLTSFTVSSELIWNSFTHWITQCSEYGQN